MIVKVQVSLYSSDGVSRALIYDEGPRRHCYAAESLEYVLFRMAGRHRAFFEAHVDEGGRVVLDAEVEDPGW